MSDKEIREAVAKDSWKQLFIMPFIDAWFVMLALGALHHINGWPVNINYWSSLLIVIVIIALFPQNTEIKGLLKILARTKD